MAPEPQGAQNPTMIWTYLNPGCFTMFYHVLPWFTPSPLHNVTLGKDGKGMELPALMGATRKNG